MRRSSPPRLRFVTCAFALVCALGAASLRAEAPAEPPKKEISEAAAAGFAKLQPLVEAKNYPDALALVKQLLSASSGRSYDAYVLWQIQAQIFLTQNRLVAAIEPLERARALAEGNPNFFDASAHLDRLYLLAQLHYQAASEQKESTARRDGYEKSLACVRDWFARSPRPSAEVHLFAASLFCALGMIDAAKPEAPRLREAADHAREALVLSPRPSTQARLLLVACLLQLGENAAAAEHLEVLAAADPKNGSTWSQLQALYLMIAAETKDPAAARAANIRALIVLDRAQALGFLSSPKDHYTRIAILFNLGQFSRAAERLEAGFAAGTVESTKRNWELLASAYQQSAREERAIDAMSRAAAAFPQDGALEFSLAQFLYGAGRLDDAYARGRSAVAKPGLEKPGQARLYLAYLAYELQRHEEAAGWISAARAAGDVSDATVAPLDRAISEALAQRQALKKS